MSRKKQSLLESHGVLARASSAHSLNKEHITRVGETSNFVVDYDSVERLILVYGKEAPTSHGFKLGFNKSETIAVINLLKQAKNLFNN